jgi:hypothetical protein
MNAATNPLHNKTGFRRRPFVAGIFFIAHTAIYACIRFTVMSETYISLLIVLYMSISTITTTREVLYWLTALDKQIE